MQKKTLLAALALSPGSKAITDVDEHQRLVVQEYPEHFSVFLVDLKEGDVTHCNDHIPGLSTLQSWVDNCVFSADINILEKRWQRLEDATMCHRCAER